jgi:C-terminal processing protease CtpA/Prc
MKIKTLLFLFIYIYIHNSFGQQKYPPDIIVEDFEFLYKNLEASHYNLFTNTSKKTYDKEYKKILESINDSLTSMQAYRLFQPFVALAQNGHCQINPFNNYEEYYENEGTVFPLNLCLRNNRMFVTNNFSSNTIIIPGDEIISINKKSVTEIIDEMHTFFSGESDYFKSTLIEMLTFPRLYWIIYARSDVFNLELKNKDDNTIKIQIDAITVKEFEAKNAVQKPLMNNNRDFYFINNIPYLHPGVFLNLNAQNEHETSNNKKFCRFIDSVFIEIYRSQAENLIIDLRNNPGGHNSFSDYMLSYIADKPFRFSNKFMVRTSELTKNFWKEVNDSSLLGLKNEILTNINGARFENILPYKQPQSDSLHFAGRVFVLVNRYDFSQAVNAAAIIQDYNFGILVGEETADHSSLFASTQTFILPNTALTVQYPKAFIVRPNGDEKAKGIIPDHLVKEDIFTKEDEILEYTLYLIRKGNK